MNNLTGARSGNGVRPIVPPVVSDVIERADHLPPDIREPIPVPERPGRPGPEVPLRDGGGLFISPSGHLVPNAGQDRTEGVLELGDTLFRAGQLSEDGRNIFAAEAITVDQKTVLLTELIGAFNQGLAEMPRNAGFETPEQALQIRASVGPLILDLARSLNPADEAEGALRQAAVSQYFKLLQKETHGLNRDFMIYDLERTKADLPEDVRPVIEALMTEVAQVTPPYDEWFAGGNDTLRVDYHIGSSFWEEELEWFERSGFERQDNGDGTFTMKRTFEENGTETKVELLMHRGKRGIFERMKDPRVHVVAYSGHSSYGRNVMNALEDGSSQVGAKAFFGLHCGGGKGVNNAVRGRYPKLQVVQSRNSSYGYQDRRTFLNALEGFARRDDWRAISEHNRRTNSDNYYYPTDTLYRKTAEDRDADGKVDAWDRVVNYNAFAPKAEVEEQFAPKDPGVDIDRIDGRSFNGAVQRLIRLCGYNQWATELKDHGVLAQGYVDAGPDDPIFRWERRDDGRFDIRLNKHYAHTGEEALGAVLCYEMGRFCADRDGLDQRDAKLAGLLMAAKCLHVDNGSLDRQIWGELLRLEGLPEGIRLHDVYASAKEDDHHVAGSRVSLDSLAEKLERQGIEV